MKKIIAVLLCIAMCFAFAACGQANEPAADDQAIEYTLEDVQALTAPVSYTYETYNMETEELIDQGENVGHESVYVPFWATVAEETLTECSVQDGMYYVMSAFILQDGTEGTCLYVCDFENDQLVAAQVEVGNESTNYQFTY